MTDYYKNPKILILKVKVILASDLQGSYKDIPTIGKEDEVKRYLRDAKLGIQAAMKMSQQGFFNENLRDSEHNKEEELSNYKKLFTSSSIKYRSFHFFLLIHF